MAFENIDCIKPTAAANPIPIDGVRVSPRVINLKKAGRTIRFIRIVIGSGLARKLSLHQDNHNVRLLFGTGNDAGKIKILVDNTSGKFAANKAKKGSYSLTINEDTADGLFSMEFEPFDRKNLEAIRPVDGRPMHVVFAATDAMLAVED
jgi:hypothetical protein